MNTAILKVRVSGKLKNAMAQAARDNNLNMSK